MSKLLKKSVVLDIIYSCCFVLITLVTLFTSFSSGGKLLLGDNDNSSAFYGIIMIPGYISLIIGVLGLIISLPKYKDIDNYGSKLDLSDCKKQNRFVKGFRVPLVLLIIFFALALGLALNGFKPVIKIVATIILLIVSIVVNSIAKITRKKYLEEISKEDK